VQALLQNNAALACEAEPNRPRPPTAPDLTDLTPNPDRHRRDRHRPGLGRTGRAAEDIGGTPQAEPSKGQGGAKVGAVPPATSCRGRAGGGGGCWVTIHHGPCGPLVQCRIPEHLLLVA
jgi:hypothetical protein